MTTVKKGDNVEWKYGKSKAEGKVAEVSKEDIDKKVQGKNIKRKGSEKEPALVIKQDNGKEVVKSASEVTKK